jgi:predicted transcriptional regulator YdeE
MKYFPRMLLIVALITATCSLAVGQKKNGSASAEQELIALDKQWTAAELRLNDADKATIDGIVATDYKGTTPFGKLENKAEYTANLKHSDDTDVADEYVVQFFDGGKLAVMTHRGSVNGKPTYRSTHLWAKRGNKWQLIQNHVSNIGEPPQTAAN